MRQVALAERAISVLAAALHHLTRTRNGTVTLTAGATSTIVTPAVVTSESVILFDPKTANAAAELAAGTMFVATANRSTGSFTITHANAVSVDRTFNWLAAGD